MENLDWLAELVSSFPETPTRRKNLIEIAGYPSWENVNSNLLAFYFDEREEHGFGRLFFHALLDILDTLDGYEFKREQFDDASPVETSREIVTHGGNRIDLLLASAESETKDNEAASSTWAIIIENKIYHHVSNPLEDYWHSINAGQKIGLVLSLKPVAIGESELAQRGIIFKNITHRQLIDSVRRNLPEYFESADDRHLLFLKDYLTNVESHYDPLTMNEYDKMLTLFQQEATNILEFQKKWNESLRYVSRTVFSVFEEFGFYPSSRKETSYQKHFYPSDEKIANCPELKAYRWWVSMESLLQADRFECYFELHSSENTKYGSLVKEELTLRTLPSHVKLDTRGRDGGEYLHIFVVSFPIIDLEKRGLHKVLSSGLNEHFFKHHLNDAACDALAQAKQQQQI